MRIWYRFLTCVKYWYQFFSRVRNWYQFFSCVRNRYQFFTCKRNWYQFFTHVRVIGTNSSHPKKTQVTGLTNTYQFFTCQRLSTNSSHVWGIGTNSSHVWGIGTNSSHREKVAPVLHRRDEYLPILHTSEIINMRNLSTNFRPQNLLKLTVRKFDIWQMWRIGTNSSYGCEIYEMKNLRFNKAHCLNILVANVEDPFLVVNTRARLFKASLA